MVHKENWEEICGDLHAVRIIGQTGGFPKSSKENLKRSLQSVLQKSKEFVGEGEWIWSDAKRFLLKTCFVIEESPPKKRKLDAAQVNKNSQAVDEKPEAEATASNDTIEEKPASEVKDETNAETESKESEKSKTIPTGSLASGSNTALPSSRSDLIKDIESHIEIIYECLDELNETGSSSSVSKAASNDIITISSEASSQEAERSLTESTTNEGETAIDPPAHDESKNE